jgi:hypothetical protein
MADSFKIGCNAEEIATQLGVAVEEVQGQLQSAMENLSASTHAFIVQKANTDLAHNDYLRNAFLGKGDKITHNLQSDQHPLVSPDAKNLRWNKLGNNMWVVELDESAAYINDGRARMSMATAEWLLKPNDKLRRAKDGSTYKVIPMPAGGASQHDGGAQMGASMFLKHSLKAAIKKAGVNMKKIENDEFGKPKMGILHHLDTSKFEEKGRSIQGAYSKPRSPSEAAATGLKAHSGNFMIGGAAVIQRAATNKAGATKEAVVFRVVSSKHQGEDRWMAPEVHGIKAVEAAYDWAQKEWSDILKQIEEDFAKKMT